jgi:hypothetical protein
MSLATNQRAQRRDRTNVYMCHLDHLLQLPWAHCRRVPPTEAARPKLILRMTSIAARVKPFSSRPLTDIRAPPRAPSAPASAHSSATTSVNEVPTGEYFCIPIGHVLADCNFDQRCQTGVRSITARAHAAWLDCSAAAIILHGRHRSVDGDDTVFCFPICAGFQPSTSALSLSGL